MQNAQPTVTSRVLKSYIMSQYRTYEMMHHYLHNPRYFAGQFMFPLSQSAKQHLIERYYSFDENVIREILGKKLNSRTRKDLDEFDNLKRIMKRVEDAEGRTLIHDIEHQFLLPRHLARLVSDNKLDTFRKRLSVYQFSDFEYCASVFMENWTSTTMDTLPEFDPQLAQDVRDMRSPLLNDRAVMDEFRSRVSNWLSQSAQMANTPLPPVMERIQSQFKVVIRNMLSVGSMINQQKEVRNIFVEITDKLVDAFIQVGWSAMDVELFYDATISEFQNVSSLSSQFRERYGTSWIRLVTGLKLTSIRLFKQPTSQSILQRSFTR
ncbi:hypothetical protein BGX31_001594 [Mortierella sp. GBA43]|nr:hypothetical protein BGX31_001594 [Mortierella sp. GBA43]